MTGAMGINRRHSETAAGHWWPGQIDSKLPREDIREMKQELREFAEYADEEQVHGKDSEASVAKRDFTNDVEKWWDDTKEWLKQGKVSLLLDTNKTNGLNTN